MNMLRTYPYGCEMDAISAAAIAACDGLDGLVDGIVSDPDACLATFNPIPLIGMPVPNCRQAGNRTVEISVAAAVVVNATWHGIVTARGKPTWHGYGPGSDISAEANGEFEVGGVAATNCSSGTCVGSPLALTTPWFEQFLAKGDPDFNLSSLTYAEFDELVHIGRQIYRAAIDTDDPDLSRFRDAGGKMVTWHGLVSCNVPFHFHLLESEPRYTE